VPLPQHSALFVLLGILLRESRRCVIAFGNNRWPTSGHSLFRFVKSNSTGCHLLYLSPLVNLVFTVVLQCRQVTLTLRTVEFFIYSLFNCAALHAGHWLSTFSFGHHMGPPNNHICLVRMLKLNQRKLLNSFLHLVCDGHLLYGPCSLSLVYLSFNRSVRLSRKFFWLLPIDWLIDNGSPLSGAGSSCWCEFRNWLALDNWIDKLRVVFREVGLIHVQLLHSFFLQLLRLYLG